MKKEKFLLSLLLANVAFIGQMQAIEYTITKKEVVAVVKKSAVDKEEAKVMQTFIKNPKIPESHRSKISAASIKARYDRELQEELEYVLAKDLFDDLNLIEGNQKDTAPASFSTRDLENGDKEITLTIAFDPTEAFDS